MQEFSVSKATEYDSHIRKKAFIKREVIGYSTLNRELVAYTIGSKDGLLICATFHGMERITAKMSYHFLLDVSAKYTENGSFRQKLSKSGLTVIPMVNPDGVDISLCGPKAARHLKSHVEKCIEKYDSHYSKWQANANGVDINHNFDAGFSDVKKAERNMGIISPSPTRYGGEFPESEKETKALCDFCRKHDFHTAVALHSQGREIYYDYGKHMPKSSIITANEMAKISGYTVSHPTGIAVGGGFKDWFIDYFHHPAFTIEVGKGVNPLPPEIFHSEYKIVSKILWHLLMHRML
ncbi:MAG: gamma-D-glutamyl-meso-diaminopimelate peptidase [Ruminococcus sp.]|nr:gamma-D-glutamyl-meso-diaminopimelate peptidase [Ruminococcus sp.]